MYRDKFADVLKKHFEKNFLLYIISLLCIFTGIILGMYFVKYMGSVETGKLESYMQEFVKSFLSNKVSYKSIFLQTLKNNLPVMIVLWFLGLTMIGIPMILIIDIIKGFTVGFSISFFVNSMGVKGVWVSLSSVILQNIIYIPCILFCSVLAMEFSLMLFKNNFKSRWSSSALSNVASYSLIFLMSFLFMFMGFLLETYVTPNILKIII